jgi:peptidoglycan/xylan/chitin deacetylase (PgdA/CDA1 family)
MFGSIRRKIRGNAVRLLRRVLFHSGGLHQMARHRSRGAILMFHDIEPDSAEEFHELLTFLSRRFPFVPLEYLIPGPDQRLVNRSMTIALTFDDGLRNQRNVAYPILRDLGLPATFYVCPGLIDNATTTWTWEMWCRLSWLTDEDRCELIEASSGAKNREEILNWMKGIPIYKREEISAEIRSRTPHFSYTEQELNKYALMSWVELAEMDSSLINVGSHSLTHPDLPQLDSASLEQELVESRALLESRLSRSIRDFAYPNGNQNRAVVQAVSETYRSAVTTVCGPVTPKESAYMLRRIGATLNQEWTSWLLAMHTSPGHRC